MGKANYLLLILYFAANSMMEASGRHHHDVEGRKLHHHHHKKHHHSSLRSEDMHAESYNRSAKLQLLENPKSKGHPAHDDSSKGSRGKVIVGSNRGMKAVKKYAENFNQAVSTGPLLSRSRREEMKHPITTSKNARNSTALPELQMTSCRVTSDCNITNAFCNNTICACAQSFIYVPDISACFKERQLNESCSYNEECIKDNSFCESSRCICKPMFIMRKYPDFGINCVDKSGGNVGPKVDPAVIGAVVGLGLMFVIICVVLRMFSKERFRENRSIFNTPNPRLMNASLFKERRRGSALSTVSATGSAAGAVSTTTPKASSPNAKCSPQETSVAIEAVD